MQPDVPLQIMIPDRFRETHVRFIWWMAVGAGRYVRDAITAISIQIKSVYSRQRLLTVRWLNSEVI